MNRLKSSYIKRAVVYPLLVLATLIIIATIVVPKFIESLPVATDKVHAVTPVSYTHMTLPTILLV